MMTLSYMSETLPSISEFPQAGIAMLNLGYNKAILPLSSKEYRSILDLERVKNSGLFSEEEFHKTYVIIADKIRFMHIHSDVYHLLEIKEDEDGILLLH